MAFTRITTKVKKKNAPVVSGSKQLCTISTTRPSMRQMRNNGTPHLTFRRNLQKGPEPKVETPIRLAQQALYKGNFLELIHFPCSQRLTVQIFSSAETRLLCFLGGRRK